MKFRILHEDDYLIAVDKPSKIHVHRPQDGHRIPDYRNGLIILRNQIGTRVYPLHRLDAATSGVLLFSKDRSIVHEISMQFRERKVKKQYLAVVRGWISSREVIDYPLKDNETSKESKTLIEPCARIELPYANKRHPTSRFSLMICEPLTGRTHQIRRHLKHLSSPIIGDTVYGDGIQNQIFRDKLNLPGLLLHAHRLELMHPATGQSVRVTSRFGHKWHQVFDLFGYCPL